MSGESSADIEKLVEKLLAAPLEATWSVTSRCNLRCPYCLEDSSSRDAPDDSSEETRDLIVRELMASKVLKVYISGGEPLLVPPVPGYIARLRDSGAVVRLTTNGTLVDEETADRLAGAALSAAEVSLQPGTARAVRRGVSLLVARGIPTVLRVVVTPRNSSGLEDIVSPFVDSGVERIAFQEVMLLGRAASAVEEYTLGFRDLAVLRDRVEGMRRRWGEDFVGFASTTLADAELGQPVPCNLDVRVRKSCEIRPDGNVIPCAPAVVYGVGNLIAEKGLAACFRDLPRLYAPFALARPGGRCAECAFLQACRGGCRAISFLLTGDESGGNPTCRFFHPASSPAPSGRGVAAR